MSFPVSPTNGQNSVVNGITYSYSTATSSWTRVAGQVTATTTLSITNTTGSTSTNTGALQVRGGAGIGGGLFVGGIITATNVYVNGYAVSTSTFSGGTVANAVSITSTTASSSTSTGALKVTGGVGIGGDLYVGGTINGTISSASISGTVGSSTNADNVQINNALPSTIYYLALANDLNGNYVGLDADSTLTYNTTNSAISTKNVLISGTTNAVSTTTGALQVAGGLAIGKDLYVGGTLYIAGAGGSDIDMTGGDISNIGNLTANTATITRFVITATTGVYSTNTGVLQVSGGVGVAGGLYVGGIVTATTFVGSIAGSNITNTSTLQVGYAANILGGGTGSLPYQSAANTTAFLSLSGTQKSLLTAGASAPTYVTQVQATSGTGSSSAASGQSLIVTSGGLGVTGDSYFVNNVGVGGTLVVSGNTTFSGQVTFNGTATNVLSSNTYYTDNLLEVHVPPSGVNGQWTVDDGKDVGFRFHYYTNSTDTNAALVIDNTNKYLNWYSSGAESTTSVFTSSTYGTFRTGNIILTNATGSTTTQTGALTVVGGVGIGGGMVVGGTVTATTFIGNLTGTVTGTATTATNATNIAGGVKDQIPYQTSTGTTAFSSGLTYNGTTFTATNIFVPGVTNATSTLTGALQVAGGLAVGKDLYVGGTLYIAGAGGSDIDMTGGDISNIGNLTANTATITRFVITATTGVYSTNTGVLQIAGGVGVAGGIFAGGIITATNIFVGGYAVSTGSSSLTIQTAGVSQGTAATINFSTGLTATVTTNVATVTLNTATLMTTAVTLANTTTAQVGYAANLLGNGVANGSLVYQSAANTTAFLSQGTAGWLLVSQGSGSAPAFTGTASIYVNSAVNANNIIGGATNQIHYQTGAGATGFIAAPTTSTTYLAWTGTGFTWSSSVGPQGVTGPQGPQGPTGNTGAQGPQGPQGPQGNTGAQGPQGPQGVTGAQGPQGPQGVTGAQGPQGPQGVTGPQGPQGPSRTNQDLYTTSSVTYATVSVNNSTAATSTATGALQVIGGVGIGGNLYVGGEIVAQKLTIEYTTVTTTLVKTDDVIQTTNNTAATSTATGALIVTGGVGIGGGMFVGGDINTTNGQIIVNARETTDGSIKSQVQISSTGTYTSMPVSGIEFSAQYAPGAGAGLGGISVGKLNATSGDYSSYLSLHTRNNGSGVTERVRIDNVGSVIVYNTSATNSTQTGALQVVGGVGIGGGLFVGGTVTATTFVGAFSGTSSKATNIVGGTAGQLHYQSAPDTTGFVGPGTAGQILVSAGASAPTYTNTTSIQVGYAVNILGNGIANGALVYQSAANTTAFLAQGTAGWLLVSQGSGSAPAFTGTASIYVNSAVNANNIIGGATNQIPYQTGAGSTGFIAAPTTSTTYLAWTGTGFTWSSSVGPQGVTGPQGPQGPTGNTGAQGPQGPTGNTGAQGPQGPTGNTGAQGPQGPTGNTGAQGPQGPAGSNGSTGAQGPQGPAGSNGSTGAQGPQGPAGSNGSTGAQGPQGPTGNTGAQGPQGPTGNTGAQGPQGPQGNTGAQGPQGPQGNTGAQGPQGPQGNTGAQGPQGPQGNTGAQGPSGPSGPGTLNSGTAGYVPYYTAATTLSAPTSGNLFWDNTNTRLGVGTSSPAYLIDAASSGGTPVIRVIANTIGYATLQLNAQTNYTNYSTYTTYNQIVGSTNVVSNYTDFNTHYWRNNAGSSTLAQLTSSLGGSLTANGQVISPAFSISTLGTTVGNGLGSAVGGDVYLSSSAGNIILDTLSTKGAQCKSLGVNTAPSGTAGEIRATNEITAYYSSDERLKENVVEIENALEKIDQIRGVYFDWTDEHIANRGGEDGYFVRKHDVGVIAQEIETVLPEVVADRDDGYKAVRYEKIVPLLIAAIKEQQQQIAQLSDTVNKLLNK
jgi:Chaperone of endosialidase/Collagen triple helix repeat (20 copies)